MPISIGVLLKPCQAKSAPHPNISQGLYCDLHLILRQQGKTQAEAAAVVGMGKTTLDRGEWCGESNIDQTDNTLPPDWRLSIPKKAYDAIYKRAKGVGGWRIWPP